MISEIIAILLLILLIPIGIFVFKSNIKFKKIIILFLVCIVFGGIFILDAFPIDNLLKSFPTPEDAISYQNQEEIGNVVLKVFGKKSCWVSTYNLNYYTFLSKKDANGWDYCTFASRKILYKGFFKDKHVIVYHINGTDDNYVNVSCFNSEKNEIFDNKNTTFEDYVDSNISISVGYVSKIDKDYILSINGENIYLGQYFNI